MARARLQAYLEETSGVTFLFAWDRDEPDRLHVDVRGTSVEEAIDAHLQALETVWDDSRKRFESRSATHGVYWTHYRGTPGTVLIISCFRLEEE